MKEWASWPTTHAPPHHGPQDCTCEDMCGNSWGWGPTHLQSHCSPSSGCCSHPHGPSGLSIIAFTFPCEGEEVKAKASSFLLRAWPPNYTHYFCSLPIGQNLFTWPNTAIKRSWKMHSVHWSVQFKTGNARPWEGGRDMGERASSVSVCSYLFVVFWANNLTFSIWLLSHSRPILNHFPIWVQVLV